MLSNRTYNHLHLGNSKPKHHSITKEATPPFGMIARTYSSKSYRFGFLNQEQDNEIYGLGNSINFKYRVNDTRLGRFWVPDPLAAKYPHNSTYAFSENRVINAVELEGLEAHDVGGGMTVY